MTRALRIGRVLGIPIEVDLTWFAIFALVAIFVANQMAAEIEPGAAAAWTLGAVTALLFFASLVAHELAHSYLAQRQGVRIASVRLFIFGGVARMDREPRSSDEEWRLAAAGPACSLALAAFFAAVGVWVGLLGLAPSLAAMSGWLAQMNLALAVFNLLPGLPLDGGRLLRAAVWRWSGDLVRATRVASLGGKAMGYALVIWGLALVIREEYWGLFTIIVGFFLVSLASSGYRQARMQGALQGVPVSAMMKREVPALPAGITVEELVRDYLPAQARADYLVVRDEGPVGRVSVRDLRDLPREQWGAITVGGIARPLGDDELIAPETDSWEAALRLARSDHSELIVVEEGRLLGVVRRQDLAARMG